MTRSRSQGTWIGRGVMSQRQEAQAAVDLIRQHGVYGLAGSDGCRCAHFMVQTFYVDIACHKSNGGIKWHKWGVIRVTSHHSCVEAVDLRVVADEVERQLHDPNWDSEYDDHYFATRFCTREQDRKQACIYCAKPREDERGYLCNQCLIRDSGKVAREYDYRVVEQQSTQKGSK